MLEKDPLSVLAYLIELSIWSEKIAIMQLKKDEKRQIQIINAFPLRTNIIPKYVDIDTTIIVTALSSAKKGENLKGMIDKWRYIWDEYFKMNDKVFKVNGYNFARQISTDGIGCSILFIKSEYYSATKKTIVKYMRKQKERE